jgi:membrane protein required for beta-lactamase induction
VLLGHVLHLINAPDPSSDESQSRFRVLDSQLQRAIQVTLQTETTVGKLNSVSEALSLNRRYCLTWMDIVVFNVDTGK